MKKLKFILWLCLPFLMFSCVLSGDDTIIVPSNEEGSNQGDKISTIDASVLSLSIQKSLTTYISIYEGSTPPNIEGTYLYHPLTVTYSSNNYYKVGDVFYDNILNFYNQNNKLNTIDLDIYDDYSKSVSTIKNAIIIGSGKKFTVYFQLSFTDNGISYDDVYIFSGVQTSTGIKNADLAFVSFANGDFSYSYTASDNDGLAENTVWNKSEYIGKTKDVTHQMPKIIEK
jgi:hypothetical protein